MLKANETVAEHFKWMDLPFIYRVHEQPKLKKLQQFANIVKPLGYTIKGSLEHVFPNELNAIIQASKGTEEHVIVSTLLLIVLTCNNVMFANHVVILLSYFLLYGNPVTTLNSFYLRFIGLMVAGVIVALIFYIKNKKTKVEFDNTIIDVIKSFDINTEKSAWQLKLALGMSSLVFIGEMLHFPKNTRYDK